MAISFKHSKTSAIADGGDSTKVQPSDWNAEHTISMSTGKLVGRGTAGTGAPEEITLGTNLSLSGTTLNAAGGSGVPTGAIIRSSTTTPSGFLPCNGALLSQTTYATLYAAIGNTFKYYANRYITARPWENQFRINEAGPTTIGTWTLKTGLGLPAGYQVYGGPACVTNGYAYVFGGLKTGYGILGNNFTATINSDGTLNAFSIGTGTIQNNEVTSCCFQTNLRFYIVAGSNGTSATNYTQYVTFNTDGTLANSGAWTYDSSHNLTTERRGACCAVVNNIVYIFGGTDVNGTVQSTGYKATINADGSLGSWSAGPSLPAIRTYASCFATSTRVYIIGGYDTAAMSSSIYAPINADGSLGAWVTGPSIPVGTFMANIVATNNTVFIIGGMQGAASTAIYSAPIYADGSIGAFVTNPTALPVARYGGSILITNSKIYYIGGLDSGGNSVTDVYEAPFTGGKNNYLYDSFYSSTDISGSFYIPDLINEESNIANNTTVRSYIKY